MVEGAIDNRVMLVQFRLWQPKTMDIVQTVVRRSPKPLIKVRTLVSMPNSFCLRCIRVAFRLAMLKVRVQIPSRTPKKYAKMAEWSKAAVLKTDVVDPTVGSNPTLGARCTLSSTGEQWFYKPSVEGSSPSVCTKKCRHTQMVTRHPC